MNEESLLDLEIRLLLEGVFESHGHDFRNYSRPFVRKRIQRLLRSEGCRSVSGLQERVLHEKASLDRFVTSMSVQATSMFRDPSFFATFRDEVIPLLRTYPSFRVWVAGCSSGEEVWSLAMLLEEERLYQRARIYATDFDPVLIRSAENGLLPANGLEGHRVRYRRAGGRRRFLDSFDVRGDFAVVDPALRRNVVFAVHNLATDAGFNEFHVIWCRNVLIYFDSVLQGRVHRLLDESLTRLGVLGLGNGESIDLTPCAGRYVVLDQNEKLYRKVKVA